MPVETKINAMAHMQQEHRGGHCGHGVSVSAAVLRGFLPHSQGGQLACRILYYCRGGSQDDASILRLAKVCSSRRVPKYVDVDR